MFGGVLRFVVLANKVSPTNNAINIQLRVWTTSKPENVDANATFKGPRVPGPLSGRGAWEGSGLQE